MKRTGFPAGPVVLGLLLGPLAEGNLRRALVIDGPSILVTQPVSAALLALALVGLATPLFARVRKARAARRAQPGSASENTLSTSDR